MTRNYSQIVAVSALLRNTDGDRIAPIENHDHAKSLCMQNVAYPTPRLCRMPRMQAMMGILMLRLSAVPAWLPIVSTP
jgi:hypothetical protein